VFGYRGSNKDSQQGTAEEEEEEEEEAQGSMSK
jgi:hypothetical protein